MSVYIYMNMSIVYMSDAQVGLPCWFALIFSGELGMDQSSYPGFQGILVPCQARALNVVVRCCLVGARVLMAVAVVHFYLERSPPIHLIKCCLVGPSVLMAVGVVHFHVERSPPIHLGLHLCHKIYHLYLELRSLIGCG